VVELVTEIKTRLFGLFGQSSQTIRYPVPTDILFSESESGFRSRLKTFLFNNWFCSA